jgi:hypothetical protein
MRGTGPEFIRIGRGIRYSRTALEAYKAPAPVTRRRNMNARRHSGKRWKPVASSFLSVEPCIHHNEALWGSTKGGPLSGQAIYVAVCRRTEAAFGTAMNMHLFGIQWRLRSRSMLGER